MAAGLKAFLVGACVLWTGQAMALTRHFEAHCQAKDGSMFVPRAKYQYSPIALGHSSTTSDTQDWLVSYRPRNAYFAQTTPGSVRFMDPHQVDCSQVGVLHGLPVVNRSFLRKDGTWLPWERGPQGAPLSIAPRERPDVVQRRMKQLELVAVGQFALIAPVGTQLVYEEPLLSLKRSPNGHVAGVYTAHSTDGGLTWSALQVSTTAQLYVLGKATDEQPFVARLVAGGTVRQRASSPQPEFACCTAANR